jgi:hypothetical protein
MTSGDRDRVFEDGRSSYPSPNTVGRDVRVDWDEIDRLAARRSLPHTPHRVTSYEPLSSADGP